MLDWLLTPLTYVLPFLFVLTIVVTVHELGHFWTARAFGTAVDRFSIGFGSPIARWTDKGGVEWRIGWIPLGGYVSFSGDDTVTSIPDRDALEALRRDVHAREGVGAERRYFHFKPVWQRAAVVAAGPLANFLLTISIFTVLTMALGEMIVPPRVDVQAGSPAERAGFRRGDLVVSANGRAIDNFLDLPEIVAVRAGTPIEFVVQRGGERLRLSGTPERRASSDKPGSPEIGVLGLSPARDVKPFRRRPGPLQSLQFGVERTWRVLETSLVYIGRIATGRESGDQLSGPLGIADASKQVAAAGAEQGGDLTQKTLGVLLSLIQLAAILSVGIGFLNLLPVPVLDGGHLAFYAYEAVARRPVGPGVQAASYRVGLALLLGLMLFVTWNDLQRLQVFQFLGGLVS